MKPWNGVCEFIAVAETQSFTAAAKQLQISVAQVSRQVSAIEERLKIKLFHRTTRKVSLTESGSLYYRQCRQVLNDLMEAEQITASRHNQLVGEIRITAPVTYGEELIVPIFTEFLIFHPEISIQLDLNNALVDIVTENYDLAIRLGQLEDSRLIARKLSNRKLYLCASEHYLSNRGVPTTPQDLRQHNCLMGTSSHWRFQNQGKSEELKLAGRFHCNSGYSLTSAALKGIGIVQLPDYYVQTHIDSGELIRLLEAYEEPDEGVWLLYPDKNYLPYKLKVLIDFLQNKIDEKTKVQK